MTVFEWAMVLVFAFSSGASLGLFVLWLRAAITEWREQGRFWE